VGKKKKVQVKKLMAKESKMEEIGTIDRLGGKGAKSPKSGSTRRKRKSHN